MQHICYYFSMEANGRPLNGLYDTARLAKRLGVAESSVRAYVTKGRLPKPTGYLGGNVWDAEEIEAFLAAQEPRPVGRPRKQRDPEE